MADPVVNQTNLWLGGYDFSGEINAISLKAGRAEIVNSRMTDDIAVSHPGIQLVSATADGYWSAGVGSVDAVVHSSRVISNDASEWPLTFLPNSAPGAAGADGNVAYNLRSAQFGVKFGAEHGQLLPFYMTSRARTGKLDRGTVMLPKASYTGTTTGTIRQLGAVGATEQLVAILHVFSATGTWTATVESDNDVGFGTPTVRATFTAATGITRQVITVAGAITDDWWRVVYTETVAGTSTAAAVLAIGLV